jgi:hypothetical protein
MESNQMSWYPYISYFLGGALVSNAIPHFVSGVTGRSFQSPFATPSGKGLSSATVNVWWGAFNFALGYLLICRVGNFEIRATADALSAGLGALAMGLLAARLFGRFHGGVPNAK